MFGLEKLSEPKTDCKLLLQQGALITDVRAATAFAAGHIEGDRNIGLEQVKRRVNELQHLGKPIITCCRPGARIEVAARMLQAAGILPGMADPGSACKGDWFGSTAIKAGNNRAYQLARQLNPVNK